MKSKSALMLTLVILGSLCLGCSESPTDDKKTGDLIIRAWKGETFFPATINDSILVVVRDLVLRLEFVADGSYTISRASNSMGVRDGKWILEDNGKQLKFFLDTNQTEVLPIVVLTTTQLVLGDTMSRGYSLVPF